MIFFIGDLTLFYLLSVLVLCILCNFCGHSGETWYPCV